MMNTETLSSSLSALAAMSNRYGADPNYVLAGGGNTSFKTEDTLFVKGSGTALATIRPEDFVVLDRHILGKMYDAAYPADEDAREAAVLSDMMAARIPGENRRPSVETLLHDLFPQQFVLHLHPALVNALTCSKGGEAVMKALLPHAVWVPACKPGYTLALDCKTRMDAYRAETGKTCQVLFLQNHGVFFAADTVAEIDDLVLQVMGTLSLTAAGKNTVFSSEKVKTITESLESALGEGTVVRFLVNPRILTYDPTTKSLSPDHIVYAKARQLAVSQNADIAQAVTAFIQETGYAPRIVFAENLGMFSCANDEKSALTAQAVMLDAIDITAMADAFGGVQPMPEDLIRFIENWEVERYRSQVSKNS